jgi:membrane fusion protein, multidrug efflux system
MACPQTLARPATFLVLLVTALWGTSCNRAPAPPPPPPPAVTVAHPIRQQVIDWDEFVGRLEAVETVEVRARVSGFIDAVHFVEGSIVRKGDLLFTIDPAPFQAEYAAAQAQVQQAEATFAQRQSEARRAEQALPSRAISEQEAEQARQVARAAEAAVTAAKAQADVARLNVEWTRVTAPIDGRVGQILITAGNLISGGAGASPTLLTTITSIDPIYCYVDVDERTVLKYIRMSKEGTRVSARDAQIPAYIALADDDRFDIQGYIDFVNNRVDSGTGTIRARGVFSNPDGRLLPGFFARMRIPAGREREATLVAEEVIGSNQGRRYVMVVDQDNVANPRPVTLGARFGSLREVEGVKLEDRVIVNGLLRARPGATVTPTLAEMPRGRNDVMMPTTLPAPLPPATQPTRGHVNGTATRPSTHPTTAPRTTERR